MIEESALKIIILAGSLQGLLLALLLLVKGRHRISNVYLCVAIVSTTLQGLLIAYGDLQFYTHYPHLNRISWILPTVLAPSLFLYTAKITSGKSKFVFDDLLHYTPTFLYTFFTFPYFLKSATEKVAIFSAPDFNGEPDYFDAIKLIIALAYFIAAFKVVNKYQQTLLDNFSNVDKIKLEWLKQFLAFFIVLWIIGALTTYLSTFFFFSIEPIQFFYVVAVVGIYALGYKGLQQPWVLSGSPDAIAAHHQTTDSHALRQNSVAESTPVEKYKKSSLTNEQAKLAEQSLIACFQNEKPYLNPDLTLDQLAATMGIKPHLLSQVINQKFSQNFFEFVNSHRVREAQLLMGSQKMKNLTLLAIALEAGFNSKTTFNVSFRKFAGVTPREYLKQINAEK